MICPRPASVGASMAAKIPASQSESLVKTTSAPRPPRRIVSNIPMLNRRVGRLRIFFNIRSPVRLASVKSSSTRPTSAIFRNTSRPISRICNSNGTILTRIPAAVNTIGAVIILFSRRPETRLYKSTSMMNALMSIIFQTILYTPYYIRSKRNSNWYLRSIYFAAESQPARKDPPGSSGTII